MANGMVVQQGDLSQLEARLRQRLSGHVIRRGDSAYDDARRVWNGLVDRHPAIIARCADTADVVEAVRLAAEFRPLVSIRGGGHQIAGSGVCDDGLVIDLSAMRDVRVDAAARSAHAQGGATWADVDQATAPHDLVTPGGEVSTTGIGGFTLGGGMGMLMRAWGLACDNLRSVEIVTADGVVRTASPEENADLFWAVRGGGRGIGVVTSFEFALHDMPARVPVVQVFYSMDDAERILRAWPSTVAATPEAVTPELILWSVPPAPEIPAELHGKPTAIVMGIHVGPPEDAATALAPLQGLGTVLVDASGDHLHVDVQASADPLFPTGGRYYMKSHFMNELNDATIATLLDAAATRPTPECLLVVRTLGGAIDRHSVEDSAFPHRNHRYNVSIDSGWTDPAMDRVGIGWARETWDSLAPFSSGVYVNFSGLGEEADALRDAVYGSSMNRLAQVRRQYDPRGLFDAAARQP